MEISEKIRNARRAKGFSQRELGVKTGISLGAIQGYEQGRYKPKYAQAMKISDILNIPLDDLIEPVVLDLGKNVIELFTGSENLEEIELSAEDKALQASLNSYFLDLNTIGKDKLTAYAEDLTKIPEYRKQSDTSEESTPPDVLAAHTRTDIEHTPEGAQHDLDIMNDDSEWNKE